MNWLTSLIRRQPRSKLSPDDRLQIEELYNDDVKPSDIAGILELDPHSVYTFTKVLTKRAERQRAKAQPNKEVSEIQRLREDRERMKLEQELQILKQKNELDLKERQLDIEMKELELEEARMEIFGDEEEDGEDMPHVLSFLKDLMVKADSKQRAPTNKILSNFGFELEPPRENIPTPVTPPDAPEDPGPTDMSEAEIKEIVRTAPPVYIEQAKKMSDAELAASAKKHLPGMTELSIRRLIAEVRKHGNNNHQVGKHKKNKPSPA